MSSSAAGDSEETDLLLQQAVTGDRQSWGALLARHQQRLLRMVALRLDRRLQGRIDPADVIQEAYLEASQRLPAYLEQRPMPFFLWLRFLVDQKLVELHRHHLDAKMRDAGREVSLNRGSSSQTNSAALAEHLLGNLTGPSEAARRAEMASSLQQALEGLDPLDREVLALRHFEQLSNAETAAVLSIQESAASKRYVRALKRLREILQDLPGGRGDV
jgi:RNA polymerase sigma-70 factor (ECF subfamily)